MNTSNTKNSNAEKVALITGSSKGIGRAIATKLAENGYHVVLNGRNKEDLENSCNEIQRRNLKCSSYLGDLTDEAQIKLCADFINNRFAGLDLLVTNIGSGKVDNKITTELSDWKKIFDINFFSTVSAINIFLPLIKKNKGNICCISSIAAVEKIDIPISYSVAKAAVLSLVKQMMRPLAELEIRINAISPGMTWVENGSWDRKMKQDPERVKKIIETEVPLKKFVTPEEVADAVFLFEQNNSITGQNLVIDAGHTRQT